MRAGKRTYLSKRPREAVEVLAISYADDRSRLAVPLSFFLSVLVPSRASWLTTCDVNASVAA